MISQHDQAGRTVRIHPFTVRVSEAPATVVHMTPADLLAFEAAHPRHTGKKETAIRARGLSVGAYYMLLDRAAREHPGVDPITARRVLEVPRRFV